MNAFFSNHSSSTDPARLESPAMLVLEYSPDSAACFRVRQANETALAMINPFPWRGATLDQLPMPFSSPELIAALLQQRSQGIDGPFHLRHPDPLIDARLYTCQLLTVDEQLVVLSLQAAEPEFREMATLEQVMEMMPTGLILFRTIRNSSQVITDFQAVLCNHMGAVFSRQNRQDILTKPISERYPGLKAYELFHQYVAVVTTGQSHSQLFYLPVQKIWMDVLVVKYGDGLLVSFQDVTKSQNTASFLESVMSSSPASVRYYESIRDQTGRIIDFMTSTGNERADYRPYRPLESTTGQRLLTLYPYLKDNGLFDRYVAVVESGQRAHFETSHSVANQVLWLDCTAVPHENGFVLTTLDITLQKEALLAEQRQATLLQTVLDNSLTGMAWLQTVSDPLGQIVDFTLAKINATLAQTLQQAPQELEGKRLSQLMPHQMTNGMFERYAVVAHTGEAQRFEWANSTGTVWYDVSAVAVAGGLIVTFMDITAVKRTELAQQRQADLLQGVLNSSASSFLVLEPLFDEARQVQDFRITLSNPATLRLFAPFLGHEFTEEDLLSRTLLSLFPAIRQRDVFPALVSVVSTGQPIHTLVGYSQLGLTYEYDLSPFRDGVLMMTTDITPLRVYQQQLEASNTALSRSNEYLQQFAYVASHDLQEPLRKIQSFSDMLLTQYAENLDDTGQDLLRRQQNAAKRMQTLVKELLNYSRLTTQPPTVESVSLQVVVQEVLSDLETTIRDTHAQVSVGTLPTIAGNETQLRQLLQNLLANALKFTKPNQSPQVRVEAFLLTADQLPQPPLTADQGQWVALSVVDKGIGFEESQQERMFELFHRLHGRSQYTGTGIGLAVVKKVVENHRGQITARSQPGAGATFTVYLPLA